MYGPYQWYHRLEIMEIDDTIGDFYSPTVINGHTWYLSLHKMLKIPRPLLSFKLKCFNHHFVCTFQVDDDTLVNPYQLVNFLLGQSEETMGELLCKVTKNVGPIRNRRSKYYVSVREYSSESYPVYCQGRRNTTNGCLVLYLLYQHCCSSHFP